VRQLGALALVLAAVAVACGGAGAGVPLPTASGPVAPLPGAIQVVLVSRASDRGTVTAKVGDRIQIALGSEYDWRLDPPDGIVLVRAVQDQALVKGTQAVWMAAAPGTATISATGTVPCPTGRACILIAVLFSTTVVVTAP
jgi:hypothetical protein